MRLLIDTHAFLWWLLGDARLSPSALAALNDPANRLYLSSASGFEIVAKVSAGKIKLPFDVETFISRGLAASGVAELPISFHHTYEVARLPMIHRDPFDRLLIATALVERVTLLTRDAEIRKYPIPTIW